MLRKLVGPGCWFERQYALKLRCAGCLKSPRLAEAEMRPTN
jgi:hypothetical protein